MTFVDIVAAGLVGIGIVLLIMAAVLLIEIVAAVFPGGRSLDGARAATRPRIAVLVPAHDEASVIAETLRAVFRQLEPQDRLVVVADNCTDDTEQIARGLGAEVVRRTDSERRGKSYALDFGVRCLAASPPEVVIVIDADCALGANCLQTIASLANESGRPVQARYDLLPPSGSSASLRLRITAFAARVKNHMRAEGLRRLGLPCQLMGTGMALPWPAIREVNLASGELTEDLVLGLDFARRGLPPTYCPWALVTSPFPGSEEGAHTQRARWETGHLTTIVRRVPGSVIEAVRRRNLPLLALAVDVAVPPLALGALLIAAALAASGALALSASTFAPLAVNAGAASIFALAVGLAWHYAGRDDLTFLDLAIAPAYALSKLPLYAQILKGERTPWIRSKRD